MQMHCLEALHVCRHCRAVSQFKYEPFPKQSHYYRPEEPWLQAAEAVSEAVALRRLLYESRSSSEQDELLAAEGPEPRASRSDQGSREQSPNPGARQPGDAALAGDAPAPPMRDLPQGTSQRRWARERLMQQVCLPLESGAAASQAVHTERACCIVNITGARRL